MYISTVGAPYEHFGMLHHNISSDLNLEHDAQIAFAIVTLRANC